MTTFQIKLIAIITMVIDHVGLFFFPQFLIFRIAGRLSFPLFAWLIANGAHYTKDINKYLKRLFIFALISEIPYTFMRVVLGLQPSMNIFWTLGLGLLAVKVIKETSDKRIWTAAIAILSLISIVIHTDYNYIGVLSIVIFYMFYGNTKYTTVLMALLYSIPMIISPLNTAALIQMFGLFSILIISGYNGQSGPKMKYLFYAFYPVHLLVFGIIRLLL